MAGGVSAWAPGWLGFAQDTFGNAVAGRAATTLAAAASRSVLTGTSFGDNIIAVLPDVIGNTIGSLVAEGVVGSGRNKGMSPGEKALVAEAERSARAPIGTAGGQMAGAISGSQDTIEAVGQADDIIVTGVRDAVYRPGIDMPLMFLS